MAAFVEMLYARAGKSKPRQLSRHWVAHGRGLPDARLADCLRLLQAIHTTLELSGENEPARSDDPA